MVDLVFKCIEALATLFAAIAAFLSWRTAKAAEIATKRSFGISRLVSTFAGDYQLDH